MKVVYLPVEGEPREEEINGRLEDYQGLVGGFIEYVPYMFRGESCTMIVDEDGLIKGRPLNSIASLMVNQPIVGDVVIIGSAYGHGQEMGEANRDAMLSMMQAIWEVNTSKEENRTEPT